MPASVKKTKVVKAAGETADPPITASAAADACLAAPSPLPTEYPSKGVRVRVSAKKQAICDAIAARAAARMSVKFPEAETNLPAVVPEALPAGMTMFAPEEPEAPLTWHERGGRCVTRVGDSGGDAAVVEVGGLPAEYATSEGAIGPQLAMACSSIALVTGGAAISREFRVSLNGKLEAPAEFPLPLAPDSVPAAATFVMNTAATNGNEKLPAKAAPTMMLIGVTALAPSTGFMAHSVDSLRLGSLRRSWLVASEDFPPLPAADTQNGLGANIVVCP